MQLLVGLETVWEDRLCLASLVKESVSEVRERVWELRKFKASFLPLESLTRLLLTKSIFSKSAQWSLLRFNWYRKTRTLLRITRVLHPRPKEARLELEELESE